MKTRCTSAGSSWFIRKLWPAFALLIISAAAWHRRSLSAGDDCPRSMWDLGRSRTPQTLRGIAGNLSLPSKFLIMFQLFNIKNPLLPLFSRLSQHAALLVRREHCHGAFSARAQRTTSNGTAGEGIKSSSDLLWLTQRHPRSTPVFTVGDPYTPYRHIYSFNVSQWKLLKMGTSDWLHLASCKPPPVLMRNSAQTQQQNESPDLSWNQKNLRSVYIYIDTYLC